MELKLHDVIVRSAKAAIQLQEKDGSMPAGHNGPYKDPETPVRNTAHWLILFAKSYEITGEQIFKEAAELAISYLKSDKARPEGFSFIHRLNPEKDQTNGIIGHAWVIEAFTYAYKVFGDEELLDICENVFNLHPYDKELNGWRIVEVNGEVKGFDVTFNHQLWFCAAGALILECGRDSVKDSINHFMSEVHKNMGLYRDGVIQHLPGYYRFDKGLKSSLIGFLKDWKMRIYHRNHTLYIKSVGYHAFNLYAFAMIYKVFPEHLFFKSKAFKKSLKAVSFDWFKEFIETSKYAFPYNPPGFEISFPLQVFGGSEKEIKYWLNKQFEKCFDFESWMMSTNTFDSNTAAARLYEASGLDNYNISVNK